MGLLESTSARGNGRTAAFGEKLIERQAEASLASVSCDGRGRIARRPQGCEGGSAHAPSPRLSGELLLPCLKARSCAAALRGTRFAGHPHQCGQGYKRGCVEAPTFGHCELPFNIVCI